MKWNKLISIIFLTIIFVYTGCEMTSDVGQSPNNGGIDATTYVAIGSSLTAGYQSGALFQGGQIYSYPNLIAQQLKTNFTQPLMPDPGTGTKITLQSLNPPTRVTGVLTQNAPSNATHPAPFNNLGIPSAILFDAVDTSNILARAQSRSNPFYLMIMRDQKEYGNNLIAQASKLKPTLITFWLGYNDVLEYAKTGGVKGTNIGLDGSSPQTLPTELTEFQQRYDQALQLLKTKNPNAKIIVANIPNVTDAPYFTTVPIKIPKPGNPNTLLDLYYKKNSGTVAKAQSGDFVLLIAQTVIGQGGTKGFSQLNPLESVYVLDADEVQIVQNATNAFNQIIFTVAGKYNIPIVNINTLLTDIRINKRTIAGETFSTDFITGGLFSLDGIHPSAKGAGILANEFIKVMNEKFAAHIPYVDISLLPGITAPAAKRGESFKYSLDMKIQEHTFDHVINLFAQ